jgi:23S rRNA pseudouridine2605 synthase
MTKEGIRINKYLADSGCCSRRAADTFIDEGRVTINDQVAKLGDRVFDGDKVTFNDEIISLQGKKVYYALNKPKGYICSTLDEMERQTCLSLVPAEPRVFTVGRLDLFSEGLIILTNDGDFAQAVIHPKNKISKKYQISVSGDPKVINGLPERFLSGISIDGDFMKADKVAKIGESGNQKTFEVEIHQGFNRQLRKMVASLGLRVEFLLRVRIGSLKLGDLEPGKYREIDPKEVIRWSSS